VEKNTETVFAIQLYVSAVAFKQVMVETHFSPHQKQNLFQSIYKTEF